MQWLTGWKSIGNHLGIYWKTAKRWHKVYNMPILRSPEGRPMQLPEALNEWIIIFNGIRKNKER